MEWYQYLAAFFSGAFLANAVPHLVHGISGDKFPTPFARPPGKGLSPAYINVLWSAFNIAVGYLLLQAVKLPGANCCSGLITLFIGAVVMALILSRSFVNKEKE